MRKIIVGLMLTSLLAACASQKPKETTPPPEQKPAAAESTAPASTAQTQVNPLDDPNSILAKRSTYYPFDVSVVQPDDRALVAAHADFLKGHPDQKVRLEGNCDERGSAEYNLGLGQRRADGVKKLLIAGGANPDQITSTSNGKEKPRMNCHEERCWKVNRRTDIIYIR